MERSELAAVRRAETWRQRAQGATTVAIGRALGISPQAVRQMLGRTGGIAPPARRRSPRVLSSAEREEISRQLAAALTLREIARTLGRAQWVWRFLRVWSK